MSEMDTTETNKKIHAAECIKSGLEYVDCEELKIRAALAVVLVGWLALFYWMMF